MYSSQARSQGEFSWEVWSNEIFKYKCTHIGIACVGFVHFLWILVCYHCYGQIEAVFFSVQNFLPLKDQSMQEMSGSAANQELTHVLLTNLAVNLRS